MNESDLFILNEKIKSNPSNIDLLLQRASFYFKINNSKTLHIAIKDFEGVEKLDPQNIIALSSLSWIYAKLYEQYSAAKEYVKKALELDSKCPLAIASKAYIYKKQGFINNSFNLFSLALNLDPKCYFALYERAEIFRQNKFYDLALIDFDQYLKFIPDDILALSARSAINIIFNNRDLAIDDLNRIIALEPCNCFALNERGDIYFYKKDFDKALQDFSQVLNLNKGNTKALCSRAMIYSTTNNDNLAFQDINQLIFFCQNEDNLLNFIKGVFDYQKMNNDNIKSYINGVNGFINILRKQNLDDDLILDFVRSMSNFVEFNKDNSLIMMKSQINCAQDPIKIEDNLAKSAQIFVQDITNKILDIALVSKKFSNISLKSDFEDDKKFTLPDEILSKIISEYIFGIDQKPNMSQPSPLITGKKSALSIALNQYKQERQG